MESKQLQMIINVCKGTKCDNIIILKDRIIATEGLTHISEIFLTTGITNNYYLINKGLLKLLEQEYKLSCKEEIDFENILIKYIFTSYSTPILLTKYIEMINVLNNNSCIFMNEDMREDEMFNNVINMKSAEGGLMLKITEDIMFVSVSSLLPINKSDRVSMYIYTYDQMTYVVKFVINKGKYTINRYFRQIYLT